MQYPIFGSTALAYWFKSYPNKPKDLDLICETPSIELGIEHHWVPSFKLISVSNGYVVPSHLLTIKLAHLGWDIKWDKHMHDLVFLQNQGVVYDSKLYPLLLKDFTKFHEKKKVNLNKPLTEFFNNQITRKYDHDELHKLLCFYELPLHNRIRPDLNLATCSEQLFLSLSYDDQLKTALEEIYVIAYERFISKSKVSFNHAKYKALKHLITNLTSGWFMKFLILNFYTLLKYPDNQIINKINLLELPYDKL
jgi:hypothetical protein